MRGSGLDASVVFDPSNIQTKLSALCFVDLRCKLEAALMEYGYF